ncbi:large conductance mechanosensitive channel protein MscL [Candidatus Marsarchaeota archaeon]|nr:large conductance mechanosensitive channel protein MscL [Candidatus Marsarchaeota archaeon]
MRSNILHIKDDKYEYNRRFQGLLNKGNALDMEIAVIIGVALNNVVNGLVTNIITPLIGIPGHVDFSSMKFVINGSTFMYGNFINAVINFAVVSLVVFFVIIKPMSKLQKKRADEKPVTKNCPECLSAIPVNARRCAYCTSLLEK